MKEAERLYLINCGICHGPKLDGDGPLYKGGNGPFPSAPANFVGNDKYEAMPEGQMFYSVTYGKNLMGSYASQLSKRNDGWLLAYIKQAKQSVSTASTAAPGATATDSSTKADKNRCKIKTINGSTKRAI